ncbi:hypothetical protein BU24DRAFT_421346 [Aaosphaeria arxii CBS 175.79]|uniref:Uncharacterized protein n=1 Tax=Aaosphaeria arxii CBS 175.79 TaxID=1450172 RepID=A0A6A5XZW8_9PLEO|nr:uncharacterized protein BU24DRAFT_421346 [Aaosphaeria arxii CBS 175.79]KAF2018357.1 hypothetical protein BU24DRAFT_421346 [Aaosphaeria arxii CBS 175.79]
MSPEEINKEYIDLCKLYSLCEKLDDRIAREAIVIRMHKMAPRATPPFECVNVIYQGTMSDSPMRKLLVDILLRAGVDDDLNACRDSVKEEFMQDFTCVRQMHFRMRKRKEYREREGA